MDKKVGVILLIVFFIGLLVGLNVFMTNETQKILFNGNENDNTDNVNVENINNIENEVDVQSEKEESEENSNVIHVTSENFNTEVINSDKTVLIDFYADWCEPCKVMSPIIEAIANENDDIKVVKVDVDSETNLASEYSAYSIPTFVVIKDGKEVARTVGITKKADLLELINNN